MAPSKPIRFSGGLRPKRAVPAESWPGRQLFHVFDEFLGVNSIEVIPQDFQVMIRRAVFRSDSSER